MTHLSNNEIEEEQLIPSSSSNSHHKPKKMQSNINLNSFAIYSSKVNWIVFASICLFTLGSWLDISGIWCELPLLVDELPEGWRLPSILTAITQLAQVGPMIFLIGRWLFPKNFTYVRAIYVIFFIGVLSCLLLSLYWNKTEIIFNQRRSIYLYIFNFSLSLLDGMSTITFLPYIGGYFSKEYIIPNYIGESLSSLIPGILAIIQGIGEKETKEICLNSSLLANNMSNLTSNSYDELNLKRLNPNYSVSVYFLLMLIILLVSIGSFTFLNFSKTAKNARKGAQDTEELVLDETIEHNTDNVSQVSFEMVKDKLTLKKKREVKILLLIAALGCFINYGYLPGLLSYSTIPYGNTYFHLSINFSNISLPLAIFFSIWSYKVSLFRIAFEFSIAVLISVYILVISIYSPCPPFAGHWFGGLIIVFCWIISGCLFLRVRCLIASNLEAHGQNTLLIYGCVSIAGQVLGGLIIFICVDVLRLLKDKPKCSDDNFCYLN